MRDKRPVGRKGGEGGAGERDKDASGGREDTGGRGRRVDEEESDDGAAFGENSDAGDDNVGKDLRVPHVREDGSVDPLLDEGLTRVERDVDGKGFKRRAWRRRCVGRVGDNDGEDEGVVGE